MGVQYSTFGRSRRQAALKCSGTTLSLHPDHRIDQVLKGEFRSLPVVSIKRGRRRETATSAFALEYMRTGQAAIVARMRPRSPSDFVRGAAADRAANALDAPTRMLIQPLRRNHHALHLAGRYTYVRLLHGNDCVTPAARKRADQE